MSVSLAKTDLTATRNALADALADIAQDAEDRAETILGALHALATEPTRSQDAEAARYTETAWERAFAEGWGWDVLADF